MKKRKVSGLSVADLMAQAIGHFEVTNKMKSFHMVYCWMTVTTFPRWHDLYASYDANTKPMQSNAIDVDCIVPSEASTSNRSMGRKSSKAEAKRDASSQAVMETIMTLLITKEVSSEKRDDNIQHKKFAIEDIHAHNRRKGLELALLATHVNDYESYSTSMVVEENP
jgi:hypothetical protein